MGGVRKFGFSLSEERLCVEWVEEEQYLLVSNMCARHCAKCFMFSLIPVPVW